MSLENPLTILFNTEGNELAVSASQVLTGSGIQPGILVAGSSSTGTVHFMRVNSSGSVFITGSVDATIAPNTVVSQGNAGSISNSWYFRLTDGTQVLGTGSSAPVWVSGAVTVDGTVNVGNFPTTQSVKIDQSITLPVSVSNFPAITTVTGTVTAQINQVVSVSNGGPIGSSTDPVYVTGSFTATFDPSTSASVTPIASSATVVTLQAANGARRGLLVYNASTKNLYLKLGSAASLTSFSVKMSSQGYFEVPGNYTGIVTGIWDAANGFAYVTEILD